MDVDWNPAIDIQAMSRIYREGQTRPTFIYRLCARGCMEETMLQRQYDKDTLVSHVMTDDSESSSAAAAAAAASAAPDDLMERHVSLPKSRANLQALIYPLGEGDENIGETLTSCDHDPVLARLEEHFRDSQGQIVKIVKATST